MRLRAGDVVKHFKRETLSQEEQENSTKYLYIIYDFAEHTETGEKLVIYHGLYVPYKLYARPMDMFFSEVDKEKYPNIKQKYRFEQWEGKQDE